MRQLKENEDLKKALQHNSIVSELAAASATEECPPEALDEIYNFAVRRAQLLLEDKSHFMHQEGGTVTVQLVDKGVKQHKARADVFWQLTHKPEAVGISGTVQCGRHRKRIKACATHEEIAFKGVQETRM